MNGFCPNCERETPLELVRAAEEFNVRGESITVEAEYYRCQECGEQFENARSTNDAYEAAYREYRRRKGMLQPDEMRKFRSQRGLTQKEFSDLLGIGIATLNRYENGALQSEAHDRAIRLAMDARNFRNMVADSQGILSEAKKQRTLERLADETGLSWLETTRDIFGSYPADIYSGYKRLELEKLFEAIKFFCYQERVFKTKLLKLLFYADFGHFKKYSVSITGARYARLPYGPVPDQFEKWLAFLTSDEGSVRNEEEWSNDCPGEVYTCDIAPSLSIFSPSELRVLAAVKESFQGYSARKISELSHSEAGYQHTENAKLIAYSHADELNFDF